MTFKDKILNKVALLHEAEQIVKNKSVYKKFIDGTPLSNDIAVWMADFVYQHTSDLQRENNQLRADLKQCAEAIGHFIGNEHKRGTSDYADSITKLVDALALPSVQNALKGDDAKA